MSKRPAASEAPIPPVPASQMHDFIGGLRKFQLTYKGVGEAIEALEALAVIEQSTAESQARLDQARADEAAAIADRDAAQSVMQQLRADMIGVAAEAHEKALLLVAQAENDAQTIRNRGVEEANATRAAAEQEAASLTQSAADLRKAIDAMNAELAQKGEDIALANSTLSNLRARLG